MGQPAVPPLSLVNHADLWRYHKGTNAPQAGWNTIGDATLDATWATGNGGFGYANNGGVTTETNNCGTILGDAYDRYSTLDMRREFTLTSSVTLNGSNGVLHVTNSLVVPPGLECAIEPGTVLLLSPGCSVLVTNGTLSAVGREDSRIYFLPDDGTTVWGGLIAAGTNGHLVGKHIETCAGRLELLNGASGEFESSYIHDYTVSSPAIIHALGEPNHTAMTLRRCHVANYWELLLQLSTNRFEETLFEHPGAGGDGIDFDAGQPGSYLRRCTVRNGRFFNVDALDMGEYGATGEPTLGSPHRGLPAL